MATMVVPSPDLRIRITAGHTDANVTTEAEIVQAKRTGIKIEQLLLPNSVGLQQFSSLALPLEILQILK